MKKWKKFDLKQIDWRPLIRSRWFWFTIVSVLSLAAALGCVITRQPVAALRCDLPRLQTLLAGKNRRETEALLAAAAETFIAGADCPAGLAAYLRRSVPLLAADLVKNLSLGRLEMTVPCPAEWEAR